MNFSGKILKNVYSLQKQRELIEQRKRFHLIQLGESVGLVGLLTGAGLTHRQHHNLDNSKAVTLAKNPDLPSIACTLYNLREGHYDDLEEVRCQGNLLSLFC